MAGKARGKGKERRGKGNGGRYDRRKGGRDGGGGFAPLLLGEDRRHWLSVTYNKLHSWSRSVYRLRTF